MISKFLIFVFGIFIFFDANCYEWDDTSLEGKCPYGCGQRHMDYEIQTIQKMVAKLIRDLWLSDFERFNDDFFCDYYLVEVDENEEIGDYDPFVYQEWWSPYDVEYRKLGWKFSKCGSLALENYLHFHKLIAVLEEAVRGRSEICILNSYRKINEYKEDEKWWSLTDINEEKENIEEVIKLCQKKLRIISEYTPQIDNIYSSIYSWCAENHQLSFSFYHQGFQAFHSGKYLDALDAIRKFIEKETNLTVEVKLLQGEIEAQVGLYENAIQTLSEAIKLDPNNKDAYLERAGCYFELGDFDQSLHDYLTSKIKPTPIPSDSTKMIAFSLGLTRGVIKGGIQSSLEFIPSILSSLHGIGNGLWAFAKDPIAVSVELVQSAQTCVEFIKNNTPKESLKKLVPELKDLLENWDNHKHEKKGEIIGHVIGKYGIDIFGSIGVAKGVKAYRDLKKANNLLTYETMALNQRNKDLIKLEAITRAQNRKLTLKNNNLKIKFDDQGKHLIGHKNYMEGKSIVDHPDLKKLVNKHAGTGIKSNRAQNLPGQSGYQEIVNFQERIGYWVDQKTGKKEATNWGKIHYAKDGVHVVPVKPKT